jgi:hypothetical protein
MPAESLRSVPIGRNWGPFDIVNMLLIEDLWIVETMRPYGRQIVNVNIVNHCTRKMRSVIIRPTITSIEPSSNDRYFTQPFPVRLTPHTVIGCFYLENDSCVGRARVQISTPRATILS